MLDISHYPPIAWPRMLRIRQPLPGPPEIADLDQAVEEVQGTDDYPRPAGRGAGEGGARPRAASASA